MVGTGLFLPAAGSRRSTAGTLPGSTAERGQFGSYWTGTRQLAQYYSHAYIFVANDGATNDGYPIEWGMEYLFVVSKKINLLCLVEADCSCESHLGKVCGCIFLTKVNDNEINLC